MPLNATWRRGETHVRLGELRHSSVNVAMDGEEAVFGKLRRQTELATAFLTEHHDEIGRVLAREDWEFALVDLFVRWPEDEAKRRHRLPAEFLGRASSLGLDVNLTTYAERYLARLHDAPTGRDD